ncbi:unnamed protein product [Phaeothamnion confervicola]
MSSGYGVRGSVGRCYHVYSNFMECVVSQGVQRQQTVRAECVDHRDDYLECLHHRKEYERHQKIQEQKRKNAEELANGNGHH